MADNYLETIDIPDGTTLTVKDSGAARTDHVHGNITNGGAITASGVTIAADDALAIVDSSDSSKIAKTSITFDGSTTTQALTKKGSFESFLQSHQTIKQDGVTGATVNRFGTCSIAAATAAKTVSITTGTFTLEAGARVTVKFSNANTASSPTLNVNSTGAKNIFHKGSQITTGTNKALLAGTVDFIYDGTQWHLIGNYLDTDTKVNVTLGTTTKAYLLGTSTAPTSSAQAVTSIADTDVYLDSTAGKLHAKTLDATTYSGLPTATTSASGIVSLTDSVSTTSSTVAATATAVKTVNTLATTNQTNILSLSDANGQKNLLNVAENSVTASAAGFVVPETEIELEANKTYVISYNATATARSNFVAYSAIPTSASNKVVDVVIEAASSVVGQNSIEFTPSANVKVCKLYVQNFTGSVTFSNFMICTKSQFDISNAYQPYALPNTLITPELIELVDSGAKNVWDFANAVFQATGAGATYTKTDSNIIVNAISTEGAGAWANVVYKVNLSAGNYVWQTKVTNFSATTEVRIRAATSTSNNPAWSGSVKITGNGVYSINIPVDVDKTIYLFFYINYSNSTTPDNTATFSENMICTQAAWNVSHKYVPYRPNWDLVANSVDFTTRVNVTGTSTISNANLNNISVSEERVYNNPTNLPSGTSGFVICKTMIVDGNSAYQEIRFISSQVTTIYRELYPIFIRTKTSGIWRSWMKLDTDGHYVMDSGSANLTTVSFSTTYWISGTYLVSVQNNIQASDRYAPSLYMFYKRTDYTSPFLTPIVETAKSKISSFAIDTDGTATITYDAAGYHNAAARLI